MKKFLIKNSRTLITFVIPIILGIVIGKIAYSTNNENIIRFLVTISDNITVILKFITPFLVLVLCATAIFEMEFSNKIKFKFIWNMFKRIGVTLIILAIIVTTISLLLVPHLIVGEINVDSKYISPFFKLKLPKTFPTIVSIIVGLVIGFVVPKDSFLGKVIYVIQDYIFKFFRYIITPILPIWILSSFSLTSYSGSASNLFLTDIILSFLILFLQFTWLFIMYYLTSRKINKPFKEVNKVGFSVYGFVVSLSGNSTAYVIPYVIDKQEELGYNPQKSKFVSATAFNMPGSLISNIVFITGVIYMTNVVIEPTSYVILILNVMLITIIAPSIPGGTAALVQGILPNYGFNENQTGLYTSMYYKQGISNASTNNAADIYITPYL